MPEILVLWPVVAAGILLSYARRSGTYIAPDGSTDGRGG